MKLQRKEDRKPGNDVLRQKEDREEIGSAFRDLTERQFSLLKKDWKIEYRQSLQYK
jgi:hypothetical protein